MVPELRLQSTGAGATRALGRILAQLVQPGQVLALSGELGAGKTELTKGFAEGLGLDPDRVRSPTFTLHASHETARGPLEHLDTYRLHSPQALCDLGFLDLLDRQRFVVLEWADRVRELLPADAVWVELAHVGEQERRIVLRAAAPLVQALSARLQGVAGLAREPSEPREGAGAAE